jgi:uncharacterized protein YcfJ
MNIRRAMAVATLGTICSLPMSVLGQETDAQRHRDYERAKAAQTASDHRHHTGAKIVGGSAAGGAVVGALAGGGKGALIGGGVGAVGGAVANKAREHHDIKKREHRDQDYRDYDERR